MVLNSMVLKIIITLAAAGVGISSYMWFHLPPDNIIEEGCEDIIKVETGIDIDLSPTGRRK